MGHTSHSPVPLASPVTFMPPAVTVGPFAAMVQELVIVSSFLILLAMPRTTRCCLHCEKNFTNKFNYYKKHLWGRSAWPGDLIYSKRLIDSWVNDTKENRVSIPKEDLKLIVRDVYSQMDQQYEMFHTGIGYFPNVLQRIRRYEVERVNEAIKNSVRICSEHCGMQIIDYIDCTNCETKHVKCGKKCSDIGHRGLSEPVNSTSEAPGDVASKTTAIIIIPIIAAIILFLAALGGLHYCRKRVKNKATEEKRKVPKSKERDSNRKGNPKSKHRKKWKKRKSRKQEASYSTD